MLKALRLARSLNTRAQAMETDAAEIAGLLGGSEPLLLEIAGRLRRQAAEERSRARRLAGLQPSSSSRLQAAAQRQPA